MSKNGLWTVQKLVIFDESLNIFIILDVQNDKMWHRTKYGFFNVQNDGNLCETVDYSNYYDAVICNDVLYRLESVYENQQSTL